MRIASTTLSVLAGQLEAAPEQHTVGGSRARSSSTHDDATLIGAGATVHEALASAKIRVRFGIRGRVIDLYSVQPLDTPAFFDAARATCNIIVGEDHWAVGGHTGSRADARRPCVHAPTRTQVSAA